MELTYNESKIFNDQFEELTDEFVDSYHYKDNTVKSPFVFPTLYSKSLNKNSPLIYKIGFDGKYIIIESGRLLGTKRISRRSVQITKGKDNIYQQAMIYTKKIYKDRKSNRFSTIENFDQQQSNHLGIISMTANIYKPEKIDFSNTVFVQPKLDGFRFKAYLDSNDETTCIMKTRGNELYKRLTHLKDLFVLILNKLPKGFMLDGEIYLHGENFSKIQSLITNENSDDSELQAYIFDIIPSTESLDMSFEERFEFLSRIITSFKFNNKEINSIVIVDTIKISNIDELNYHFDEFIKLGFEGIMIRKGNSKYKPGRSNDLLKLKKFMTDEGVIIDIEPGKNNFKDKACLIIKDSLGIEIRMIHKGTDAEKREFLNNKDNYIGKRYQFSFQERNPSTNIPRHPVGIRLIP